MLGNYLQQTILADNIFSDAFFLCTLRVNINNTLKHWEGIKDGTNDQEQYF